MEKSNAKETIILGNAVVKGKRVSVMLNLPIIGEEVGEDAPQIDGSPLVKPSTNKATHAPDFSSVNWFGEIYTFTPIQRPAIALLWEAMEEGYRHVSQDALLQEADSDCRRIRDLFGGNPAFGTMIVKSSLSGGRAGQYCLSSHSSRL